MNQLEANIISSFRSVKRDIINLQNQIEELRKRQEELMRIILESKDKDRNKKTGTVVKNKIKEYVASREGKKFHIPQCPYAKNIKPKSEVKFKSKDSALNAGYKPDRCVE